MVIMDRQDYINKANHLLNQSTYKVITKDPTNTIKNKLINILKSIKTQTGLGINTYKSMYPTGCVQPKFYGLPKIHKPDTPLRPIVSSCGSVTYGVAKELAKILKPLVGKSPHHITSTQDFVEQARHFKLEPGVLCRAVRGRELEISFLLSFRCLGEIILLHIYCVLRYTTARLQVLLSSRHLGGITKGCSNNYDSKSLLLYLHLLHYTTVQ